MKMFSSLFQVSPSHSSILLQERNYNSTKVQRIKTSNIVAIWLGILLLLVHLNVIMVLESKRSRVDEEDEEVGSGGFENHGEEEKEENGDNEGAKTKSNQTPLWKYVSRSEGGKWGGTTKFTCLHCKNTYPSSYTHARKHLCGKMSWDGNKQIRIITCGSVSQHQRAKFSVLKIDW